MRRDVLRRRGCDHFLQPDNVVGHQDGRQVEVVGRDIRVFEKTTSTNDVMEKLARESKPKLIVAGASAYSRHWDYARIKAIADEVGARVMVDMAHVAGLVAAGGLVITITLPARRRGEAGTEAAATAAYGACASSNR